MERLDVTRTGLPGIPELPWGAHICLFYESGVDLLDILVPFAVAGIENGEAVVVTACEAAAVQQLVQRLHVALPRYDALVASGQLEVARPQDTYVPNGHFIAERTTRYWMEKMQAAVDRGFSGFRANGDEAWLQSAEWEAFQRYEESLGAAVAGKRAILVCAYGLDGRSASEIFEVAHSHQVLLAKRGGQWEALEAAELGQTRKQLQALRADLEWRVLQRTEELTAANERLRREIAERTRVERALRESEARFRIAFESSPMMTSIARLEDERIVDANRAFLRVFEYERAELIGRTSVEIGLWLDLQERERVLGTIRRMGSMLGFPFRGHTKSGRELDLLGFAERIEVDGQQCVLVASLDLTARHRAEKALLEQQWLLSESERLTGTGSAYWDPATGQVVWSREMFRIHGQDPALFEPSFDSWVELIHPEDRGASLEALQEVRAGPGSFSIEHRIVRPDGSIRWVRSVGFRRLEGQHAAAKMVGYVIDITDKRESERATREATAQLAAMARKVVELQEAERRRLAGELHDRVGQNLTAIALGLDTAARQLQSREDFAGRAEVLARLEDCAALLESTSEAVSDVAAEMRPPMLDDLGLMPALQWYARAFSQRTGIEVRFRGAHRERLSPDRELAAFRIAQEALMNVAEHARAQTVEIAFREDERECSMSICDDGIGPQAAGQRARSDRGLGLITMRERATAIGGTLEFGPRAGGGTCVVVRAPLSVER